MKIKAISIKDPWASLIRYGYKTIETRKWKTNYRGKILICTSINQDDIAWNNIGYLLENKKTFPGHAICIATLVNIRPMIVNDQKKSLCNIYDNAYSWILEDIIKIKPFPVKGKLSLFNVEI